MKRRIAVFLSLILLMSFNLQVSAATNSVGSLYGCMITVGCDSRGVVVTFEGASTTKADEIGCRNIVLVEKNGSQTKTINVPSGSASGAYSYGDAYLYTGAVEGRTYYAYCTFYAKYGSTEKTASGSTNEMVYRK